MEPPSLRRVAVSAATLVLITVAVTLLVASVLAAPPAAIGVSSSAVVLAGGVPVGVEHTQAGALAAADNYLALASQSIEQEPTVFAALVAQAYEPALRTRTLTEAQTLRTNDVQNVSNYRQGGRGVAVVAARRLDRYTGSSAVITSWLAGLVWGPHLSPRQTWNLVDMTLSWHEGRWLISSCVTDPTPAPVPSIVYVDGANDTAGAFARLAGMSAPFYGTGG
jgi:hypothetical protein